MYKSVKLIVLLKYCIPFILLSLLVIEINSIIFVIQELSMLNGLGLVRYHAQRALNCYLLVLMKENTTSSNVFHHRCFESSINYIKNYNKYNANSFILNVLNQNDYVLNIKTNINTYLPNYMLNHVVVDDDEHTCLDSSDGPTEYLNRKDFIKLQVGLKDLIVDNVTSLLDEKLASLKNVYITESSVLFLLSFCAIGYVIFYYDSRRHFNNMKTEKTVINQLCHELRTSLTPVEMYTREFMNSDKIDFEQKQFINNYILTSINQHKYILSGRLDFEKMMSNKYELKLENVELIKLVKSNMNEIEQYIGLCNKPLTLKLRANVEYLCVQIDKLVFHHIITNILRNSVKYSDSGTITVNIKSVPPNNIRILISDDGIGLTPEMISTLNSRKNSIIRNQSITDSYGLGIRFTKKLVSLLHDGSYYIESRGEHLGSMSVIEFRTYHADNMYIKEQRENISEKIIICITDDCPIVRNVMKHTLQSIFKKTTIIQFNNGEELLKYKFCNTYSYVHIIDEHMHSTGGILLGSEVSKILKQRSNEKHYTISMSGNDLNTNEQSFDIVWNKPPPPNEVIESKIKELIRPSLDCLGSSISLDIN